jgi:hypothetical protein
MGCRIVLKLQCGCVRSAEALGTLFQLFYVSAHLGLCYSGRGPTGILSKSSNILYYADSYGLFRTRVAAQYNVCRVHLHTSTSPATRCANTSAWAVHFCVCALMLIWWEYQVTEEEI